MLPIHRILHPTDYSDCSRAAFDAAAGLAKSFGAELVVLHVMPPIEVIPMHAGALAYPHGDRQQARAMLEKVTDPSIKIRHLLIDGNPIDEILRTARSEEVNLIVMGTHGWRGLKRFLLGSVAEQVLRKAPCPVLTVKAAVVPAAPEKTKSTHCATI
jgi:nucleotide-binding universal stress UspA family protein